MVLTDHPLIFVRNPQNQNEPLTSQSRLVGTGTGDSEKCLEISASYMEYWNVGTKAVRISGINLFFLIKPNILTYIDLTNDYTPNTYA